MARPKKEHVEGRQLTERQQRIKDLQGLKSAGRSSEESAELAALHAEERRDRWTRLHPKRVKRARDAVRSLVQMGNPQSYQYTEDEAAALTAAVEAWAKEVRRAFTGAPRERGLYDL